MSWVEKRKPDLIGAQGDMSDETVRKLLKIYIDQFAAFAARFRSANVAAAAWPLNNRVAN
jgi:hypothetical protein